MNVNLPLLQAFATGAATAVCSEFLNESDSEDEEENNVLDGHFGILTPFSLRKRINECYRAIAILRRRDPPITAIPSITATFF